MLSDPLLLRAYALIIGEYQSTPPRPQKADVLKYARLPAQDLRSSL